MKTGVVTKERESNLESQPQCLLCLERAEKHAKYLLMPGLAAAIYVFLTLLGSIYLAYYLLSLRISLPSGMGSDSLLVEQRSLE